MNQSGKTTLALFSIAVFAVLASITGYLTFDSISDETAEIDGAARLSRSAREAEAQLREEQISFQEVALTHTSSAHEPVFEQAIERMRADATEPEEKKLIEQIKGSTEEFDEAGREIAVAFTKGEKAGATNMHHMDDRAQTLASQLTALKGRADGKLAGAVNNIRSTEGFAKTLMIVFGLAAIAFTFLLARILAGGSHEVKTQSQPVHRDRAA